MKSRTSRSRHEPPSDRVALFATFENLRKRQGRSKRLLTTYPLGFQPIGAGRPVQAIPAAFAPSPLARQEVSPPRVEGVGGLADQKLGIFQFTGHRCGTRSARTRGCLCDPCKGSVVVLGMPGGEREARAQAGGAGGAKPQEAVVIFPFWVK